MTPNLQSSLAVSCGLHLAVALFVALFAHLARPVLPSIMEITLVSGPGGGGGGGSEMRAGVPGRAAPAPAAEVKAVRGGLVSVASPEFVTVGKRPQRTEESLMGADSGGVAGPAAGGGGSTAGGGPGGGGGPGRQLHYQEPLEYPDWAKEQGIDARVVLRFKVMPDGTVDSSVIVRRTSGWRKLDELAIRALRNFLFEPLGPQLPQLAQWGELSFHFKPE